MEKLYENSETGCCPRFDPEPWNEKEVEFDERLFLKDHVRTLFHIPLNFGRVMVRNMERIKQADGLSPEPLLLCDTVSLWRTEVYIAVSKEIPGAEMARVSGKFLTKVFEGPYKDSGKWLQSMKEYMISKGNAIKKMYFYYTTCPRCAKVYGKNYTVILAEL